MLLSRKSQSQRENVSSINSFDAKKKKKNEISARKEVHQRAVRIKRGERSTT